MSTLKACSRRGSTALSVHGCTCVLVLSIQVRRTGELEGHSGSALVPNGHRLDAGEDLPLMAGQSHAHVQQIPETKQDQRGDAKNHISVFLVEYFCTKYLIFVSA